MSSENKSKRTCLQSTNIQNLNILVLKLKQIASRAGRVTFHFTADVSGELMDLEDDVDKELQAVAPKSYRRRGETLNDEYKTVGGRSLSWALISVYYIYVSSEM